MASQDKDRYGFVLIEKFERVISIVVLISSPRWRQRSGLRRCSVFGRLWFGSDKIAYKPSRSKSFAPRTKSKHAPGQFGGPDCSILAPSCVGASPGLGMRQVDACSRSAWRSACSCRAELILSKSGSGLPSFFPSAFTLARSSFVCSQRGHRRQN